MLEICVGGRFLEDCFYCYSQQTISAVANESLISHNLISKRSTRNTELLIPYGTPSQIKKTYNTAQLLERTILLHTNINNKNTCKIVCKMQYLKNGLQFNVSEGSLNSIKPIPTNVF